MRQAIRFLTPAVKVPPESVRAPHRGNLVHSRRCPVCQTPLTGREAQQVCSGKCRAALSRQKKAEELTQRDRRIRKLLEEALGMLGKPENTTCMNVV